MTNAYEQMKANRAEYRRLLETLSHDIVKDASKAFFEQNPDVVAFGWDQYTPYFMDGDACEFGVHDAWPISREGVKEFLEEHGADEGETVENFNPERLLGRYLEEYADGEVWRSESFAEVQSVVSDQDLMLQLFGDHVTVLVYRQEDGEIQVSTERCDHD